MMAKRFNTRVRPRSFQEGDLVLKTVINIEEGKPFPKLGRALSDQAETEQWSLQAQEFKRSRNAEGLECFQT